MAARALTCPGCRFLVLPRDDGSLPSHCPACGEALTAKGKEEGEARWYFMLENQQTGPVGLARLRVLAETGLLQPTDMLLPEGSSRWISASALSGVFPAREMPAAAPVPAVSAPPALAPKPATVVPVAAVSPPPAPVPKPQAVKAPPAAVAHPVKIAPTPAPAPVAKQPAWAPPGWFYMRGQEKVGPVVWSKLVELANSGQLRPDDLVLDRRETDWKPARSIADLFPDAGPPPAPKTPTTVPPTAAPRVEPAAVPAVSKPTPAPTPKPAAPIAPPPPRVAAAAPTPAQTAMPAAISGPVARLRAALADKPEVPAAVSSPQTAAPTPPVTAPAPVATRPVAPVAHAPGSSAAKPAAAPVAPVAHAPGSPADSLRGLDADTIVKRFESAWLQGKRPQLDDYLPSNAQKRAAVLARLVRIDLQCRLNGGEAARIENYLERFPALASDRTAVLELIALEYQQRESESGLSPDEYFKRFPQYQVELTERIGSRIEPSKPAGLEDSTRGLGPAGPGVPEATTETAGEAYATAVPAAASDFPRVPGHEVLGVLGRGGMGVVYKARHIKLNRLVALKMILAGQHASAQQRERFLTEARAVAKLYHPNIVQVYEAGECPAEGGALPLLYCSLELAEGGNLAQVLDGAPQPPRQCAELVEKLADAMQSAHAKGIIHRDLKPANILLQKPETRIQKTESESRDGSDSGFKFLLSSFSYKITDFGLAKQLGEESGQTASGAILGTPSYMAPEQAVGNHGEVGPAADIYALGAILYEVLTGRPPFKGATVLDTLDQVHNQEPVPPSGLQWKVPRDLDTICLKCLQKEPGKRYATAGDLAQDLRRYLAGKPILARPAGFIERTVKYARREPKEAVLLAGVVLLALAGSLTTFWKIGQVRREKESAETSAVQQVAVAHASAAKAREEAAAAGRMAQEARDRERRAAESERKALTAADEANKQKQRAEQEAAAAKKNEQDARDNERRALEAEKKALESEKKALAAEKLAREEILQAHRQQAAECEKAKQWYGAAFHLGKLIESQPKDEQLLVRRADALRQLGQWLPAAADYSRALDLNPSLPVKELRLRCLERSAPVRAAALIGLGSEGPLFLLPPLGLSLDAPSP